MNEKLITSVTEWLESIMPSVVETLVDALTPETLEEMGKEQGIHGPISIDLEEFEAPITAINFFVVVQRDAVMLATTADIKDAPEDYAPPIKFGYVFTADQFAKGFTAPDYAKRLTDDLVGQFKECL